MAGHAPHHSDHARRQLPEDPGRPKWLERLPDALAELLERWALVPEAPFESPDVTASWVAPVRLADGRTAVLKLGLPHMEAEHELHGLRFWNGDPTVNLLDADEDLNAMLIERCVRGSALRGQSEPEQDEVIASLLRRLWRAPDPPHPFRSLSDMLSAWGHETLAQEAAWPDKGLVRHGLSLFQDLCENAPRNVLLATDLHAGNVLRAEREPWLAIDPKPFIGDPAYDATQHLFNCPDRMRTAPLATIERFAGLLGLEPERIRLWTFARAAAEPRENWPDERWAMARILAP